MAARLFDILGLTTVFILLSTLNVVQGNVIPDYQVKTILHKLTELEDKFELFNADVEDIHAYLFDDETTEGCLTDRKSSALISGKRYQVPDAALTASGSYNAGHGPRCSRLGVPKHSGCGSHSWSAKDRFKANQWLQVDLGGTFEIHAVATQGRGDTYRTQWLTTYKIASLHGSKYVNYMDRSHGGDKIFHGNVDRTTVVRTALAPPIHARFVRLYPHTWHDYPSVRWELYGKPTSKI